MNWILTPIRARILIALLAFAAYLPSLSGDFLSDDARFVRDNEAVHGLSAARAVRAFTDPSSLASVGWQGIYRPLRTLDFAIDWTVSGGRPWLFHLRNVLYHILGSLLVLALFSRLVEGGDGERRDVALFGACLFAFHPVHTESVAFISSRGDLLLLCFFAAALLQHVKGRFVAAALLLVPAVLAKESAVVFPAAVFLVDRFRKVRLPWRWYGAYAGISLLYVSLWFSLIARGSVGEVAQVGGWFGGSYGANLVTVARGFVYDLKLLAMPVNLVFDYFVPARRALDPNGAFSILIVVTLATVAVLAGRRSRFAAGWFLVTILPVSGIFFPMMIPTAERFLLLPSIGLCLWAALFLPRHPLRIAVLLCFLSLTFFRCFDWRDSDTLWEATYATADTPGALFIRTARRASIAARENDAAAAREALETADAFVRLYREDLHITPSVKPGEVAMPPFTGGLVLANRAKALLVLGRDEEALDAAVASVTLHESREGHLQASIALERLGQTLQAANAADRALKSGPPDPAILSRLARLLFEVAREAEERGELEQARTFYGHCLRVEPDPEKKGRAREALDRLR